MRMELPLHGKEISHISTMGLVDREAIVSKYLSGTKSHFEVISCCLEEK